MTIKGFKRISLEEIQMGNELTLSPFLQNEVKNNFNKMEIEGCSGCLGECKKKHPCEQFMCSSLFTNLHKKC